MEEKIVRDSKVENILSKYGLDFHIEKAPLIAINSEGKQVITPYFGLINDKTMEVINTCKEGYTVSQNYDVVHMIMEGINKFDSELNVSKAGSIDGGRKVFMQLEINGKSKVGGDTITKYVTIVDSNDGSTGLSIGIGDLAAHCTNQFFRFYKAGNAKFRHTATLKQKIESIPSLIETALNESMEQIKIYNKFLSTSVSRELADKMVNYVLGYDRVINPPTNSKNLRTQRMIDTLYSNIDTEFNQCGENLWGLFNGVTRYTTHEMSRPKRENGLEESLIVGNAYDKGIKAYEFSLDYIN